MSFPSLSGARIAHPRQSLFHAPLTNVTQENDTIAPAAQATVIQPGVFSYDGQGVDVTPSGSNASIEWDDLSTNKIDVGNAAYIGRRIVFSCEADFTRTSGVGTGDTLRFMQLSSGSTETSFAIRVVANVLTMHAYWADGSSSNDLQLVPPTSNRYSIVFEKDGSTVNWYNGTVLVYSTTLPRFSSARFFATAVYKLDIAPAVRTFRFSKFRVYLA